MTSRTLFDLPISVQKKIKQDPVSGCWIWTAGKCSNGYGILHIAVGWEDKWPEFISEYRNVNPHRVIYKFFKGNYEEHLEIDHLCRNRACVNPDHLEAVTAKVNCLRGEGITANCARKTHCLNGHLLAGENLYLCKRKDGGVSRICRLCTLKRGRTYEKSGKRVEQRRRRKIALLGIPKEDIT